MRPIVIDADTGRELWRVADCAAHCGISPATFSSYHRKRMPPAPVAHLDNRTPLWDPQQVREWHASRPGPGNWRHGK